ncbi:ATP-binding protein [Methylocystis echinoides]|uniref:hybrid sensor histidine kinase/response regulator n=1 Tax=Methylocystis echinoides TaxID=29468 RepID=UPI0034343B00
MQPEKLESSLPASEDLTRAILENSPDSLGLLDAAGRLLLINETCRNLLAVDDFAAASGKEWRILWPESARPQVDKAMAAARSEGRGRFRGWCATANGEPKFWDVIVTRLSDGGGTARYLTVSRDITDIKRMEDALRRSARSTALTSEAAAELLRRGDPQVVVEDICRKAMAELDCQYFFNFLLDRESASLRLNAFAGVPEEEAREFEQLDYSEIMSGWVARNSEPGRACAAYDLHAKLRDSYGVTAFCCHPLLAQGEVFGLLSFGSRTRSEFNDSEIEIMETLSQYVSMAMARAQMERTLRESDKRKDEFIAALAHELRNPLAAIHNAFSVLNEPGGGAAMPKLRPILDRQLHLLVRLVDDLLDIARIKTGKIELRRQCVDLMSIVTQSVEAAEPSLRSRVQEIGLSLPSEASIIEGDPARLMQVFTNLLDNAAKYAAPHGRIDVTATNDGANVIVSVRDNGVGIPAEKLESIFDLFNQSNRPRYSQDGLGVGLTLARSLVHQHGGKLEAHSGGPGLGSEFLVCLPLLGGAPNERENRQDVTSWTSPVACRALVVDDDRDVADSLVMFLKSLGVEARVIYSGKEALELLADYKPHLILLDIGMPRVDGFETARRIRELPDGRRVHLVALSGWELDKAQAIEAGFDRQFVKPITVADLQQAILAVEQRL